MSKFRLVVAAAIAAFLLLTLLDRFTVIEILVMRAALPLVVALAEAIAIVGAGFAVRGLRGRVWHVQRDCGALDLPLDFVIGYPLFGTLCFLIGTLQIAKWTMLPLLVIAMLFGAFAIARWREETADGGQRTAGFVGCGGRVVCPFRDDHRDVFLSRVSDRGPSWSDAHRQQLWSLRRHDARSLRDRVSGHGRRQDVDRLSVPL